MVSVASSKKMKNRVEKTSLLAHSVERFNSSIVDLS